MKVVLDYVSGVIILAAVGVLGVVLGAGLFLTAPFVSLCAALLDDK